MIHTLKEQLTPQEFDTLVCALPRITILIAGADGAIDEGEWNWAERLTHIRSFNHPHALNGFYEALEPKFSELMSSLLSRYSRNPEERCLKISDELSHLNPILAKLDPTTAHTMYDSLKSFAWNIARSSGGFLGFGAISAKEEKWIKLPMIEPIEPVFEEE